MARTSSLKTHKRGRPLATTAGELRPNMQKERRHLSIKLDHSVLGGIQYRGRNQSSMDVPLEQRRHCPRGISSVGHLINIGIDYWSRRHLHGRFGEDVGQPRHGGEGEPAGKRSEGGVWVRAFRYAWRQVEPKERRAWWRNINLYTCEVRGQADHIPTWGWCVRLVVAVAILVAGRIKILSNIRMLVKLNNV